MPEITQAVPSAAANHSMKAVIRSAISQGLYHSGLLGAVRSLGKSHYLEQLPGSSLPKVRRDSSSKFAILCYHRVGTEGVPYFSRLEPAVFEAQMRYLKQHYRIVSLDQMYKELQEKRSVEPTIAVTFDDGYKDLYSYAFPVLKKFSIPSTIYLIGECMENGQASWYDRIFVALKFATVPVLNVDLDESRSFALASQESRNAIAWEIVCYLRSISDEQRRAWCVEFERSFPAPQAELDSRILDWNQVHEMRRSGVDFGAHTMTHPSVSHLEGEAFTEELIRSKKLLESRLDSAVDDFAYPFGKDSDRSEQSETILRGAGYRSAVTTIDGYNTLGANLLQLRRQQIGNDRSISSFAFGISRLFLESPLVKQSASQPTTVSPLSMRTGR
jgi:peptidoglycan/xylan/chitin deacetylase (PgdA/CDA1 family)